MILDRDNINIMKVYSNDTQKILLTQPIQSVLYTTSGKEIEN